ncbi:MAG: DUF2398 family protein [bacterium]|nr:DUF2398 family protein [bacterium]MDE0288126.1 DUF2398 family protein [bacterium]MDE0438430.1 DUF2398 family protein [bacterium]
MNRAPEVRAAARHVVAYPLVLAERDPETFRLIRRHEHTLDRWFTQRFGYRLQVTADTARLFKSAVVAQRRPLLTATEQSRPFSQREYTMLALSLAAVAAGPDVISLRDLVHEIRSMATDAGVTITDEAADAVLRIRPDRVALLPLPVLSRSETVEELLDRSDSRRSSRAWMRSILLEEPVLYRTDLTDREWSELRRRLGQESDIFYEMFGMEIEARAEGVVVIDPEDRSTDSRFPRGGTVPHAALLLVDLLLKMDRTSLERREVVDEIAGLTDEYRRYWSKLADHPDRLTEAVLDLLQDHRLAEVTEDGVRILPAAWRYSVAVEYQEAEGASSDQMALV